MELTPDEQAMLAGERGEAVRKAVEYQVEVGKFWGAKRFVPVTNVHMMGDIEVMGDGGLEWLENTAKLGARCIECLPAVGMAHQFGHPCTRLALHTRLGEPGLHQSRRRDPRGFLMPVGCDRSCRAHCPAGSSPGRPQGLSEDLR